MLECEKLKRDTNRRHERGNKERYKAYSHELAQTTKHRIKTNEFSMEHLATLLCLTWVT